MSKLTVPVDKQDHMQGSQQAPIILVEYGDYECPYCGEAYPLVKEVKSLLGKSLCFVFRNFPLTESHAHAMSAAVAAEAGALQGKFWQMHDMLYENQGALEDEDLLGYARDLRLDTDAFQAAFRDKNIAKRIKDDFRGGVRSGVNGTPSFYINGIKYEGPLSAEALLEDMESMVSMRK